MTKPDTQTRINPLVMLGYEGDKLNRELYKSAEELEIIKDFDEEAFNKRFFYLFIERNHNLIATHGFREDLFEAAEKGKSESKNFPESMKRVFLYIFTDLIDSRSKDKSKSRRIDLELINNIYSVARQGIREDVSPRYRSEKNLTASGVNPLELSVDSLSDIAKTINEKNGDVYYELIPDQKAGSYHFMGGTKESIDFISSRMSEDDVGEMMAGLIDVYYGKMDELKNREASEDEKINLIGTLLSDIMKLHPFENGNGRTFCFGLLNYLLIQENLSPCMIFNPWHIEHANAKDRTSAIMEGQKAFQKYFIKGDKVKGVPLTEEVKKMNITEDQVEQIEVKTLADILEEVPNILMLYIKMKASEEMGQDSSDLKDELGKKIENMESNGYLTIMNNLSSVPYELAAGYFLHEDLHNKIEDLNKQKKNKPDSVEEELDEKRWEGFNKIFDTICGEDCDIEDMEKTTLGRVFNFIEQIKKPKTEFINKDSEILSSDQKGKVR